MVQMNFGGQPSPYAAPDPVYTPPAASGYGAPAHTFEPRDPTDPVEHPRPVHFYHLFAGAPDWLRVADEHFRNLATSEFWGEVRVGLVGTSMQRQNAREWLDKTWPGWIRATEADQGFEQVTQCALHEYVQDLPVNAPVLYAHTKGSFNVRPHQDIWRRCMERYCVNQWRDCAAKLDEGYDTAGVHYLLPEDHTAVGIPMYGGNYWWGTAGYLAGLPAVRFRDRWDAEGWVGLGDPKAYDFVPGWPNHPHALD
jgi:hypothetical protein